MKLIIKSLLAALLTVIVLFGVIVWLIGIIIGLFVPFIRKGIIHAECFFEWVDSTANKYRKP